MAEMSAEPATQNWNSMARVPQTAVADAFEKFGSNKGHASLNLLYSCVVVGCHLRRKVFEFAVSHEPHNPKVVGSNPPLQPTAAVSDRGDMQPI